MKFIDWVILVIITVGFLRMWNHPYDDTDDVVNKKRSGLVLYTDNKTGCQYLSPGLFGNLSPRLDGQGRHLGCK